MREPFRVGRDTYVLPATLPVPNMGVQYLSPLVMLGREPLLVDTGAAALREEYFEALFSLVDPTDVQWIFLSHDDRDHTGGLLKLLELCPSARVITSFQGVNRITKEHPLPLDRLVFANVGESVDIGDRSLHLFRPPLFDSPATRGFWDDRTGVCYTVDAFGAVTPEYAEQVTDVDRADYREGFHWLNRANTPWLSLVDLDKLAQVVKQVHGLAPSALLSYHGPAATADHVDRLCELLLTIPIGEAVRFPSKEELAATAAVAAVGE